MGDFSIEELNFWCVFLGILVLVLEVMVHQKLQVALIQLYAQLPPKTYPAYTPLHTPEAKSFLGDTTHAAAPSNTASSVVPPAAPDDRDSTFTGIGGLFRNSRKETAVKSQSPSDAPSKEPVGPRRKPSFRRKKTVEPKKKDKHDSLLQKNTSDPRLPKAPKGHHEDELLEMEKMLDEDASVSVDETNKH